MNKKKKKEIRNSQPKKEDIDIFTLNLRSQLQGILLNINSFSQQTLVLHSSDLPVAWYRTQIKQIRALNTSIDNLLTKEEKRLISVYNEGAKELHLTQSQIKDGVKNIKDGMVELKKVTINEYRQNITTIYQKSISSKAVIPLQKIIADSLTTKDKPTSVVYSNGKKYRWDSYIEMRTRTEINNEVSQNVISNAQNNGIIFYICNYFGDCAPDHEEYQGKIYVDEKWQSLAPKDRLDEIEQYISSNKIMTVQEVTSNNGNYLTTRPNCRHMLEYMGIDEVLGIKTKDQLQSKRQEMDLNFNGKYKPDKYEAMQTQRAYERNIVKAKMQISAKEKIASSLPKDSKERIALKNQIKQDSKYVRTVQKQQRELLKNNTWLNRQYSREQPRLRTNLGVKRQA